MRIFGGYRGLCDSGTFFRALNELSGFEEAVVLGMYAGDAPRLIFTMSRPAG